MIKMDNHTPLSRVQLLQAQQNSSSPNKRNIKIANQKFPSGFFHDLRERESRECRESRDERDARDTRQGKIARDYKDGRQKNSIFQSMSKISLQNRNSSSRVPQTHQQIRNTLNLKNKLYTNSKPIVPSTHIIQIDHISERPGSNQFMSNNNNTDTRRKEMSTALEYRGDDRHLFEYEQGLIKSVLSTAREMKKMIRKHSIELKKDREYNIGSNIDNLNIKVTNGVNHQRVMLGNQKIVDVNNIIPVTNTLISNHSMLANGNGSNIGYSYSFKQKEKEKQRQRERQKEQGVELPPLKIKRGFTTAF